MQSEERIQQLCVQSLVVVVVRGFITAEPQAVTPPKLIESMSSNYLSQLEVSSDSARMSQIADILRDLQKTPPEMLTKIQQMYRLVKDHDIPPLEFPEPTAIAHKVRPNTRVDLILPPHEYVLTELPHKGLIERLREGLVGYRSGPEVCEDMFVLSRAVIHRTGRLDPRHNLRVTITVTLDAPEVLEPLPSVTEISRPLVTAMDQQKKAIEYAQKIIQVREKYSDASQQLLQTSALLQQFARCLQIGDKVSEQHQTAEAAPSEPTNAPPEQMPPASEAPPVDVEMKDVPRTPEPICNPICSASWMTIVDHIPWEVPITVRNGSIREPFVAVAIPIGCEGLYSHALRFAQPSHSRFQLYATWQAESGAPVFPANALQAANGAKQPSLLTMQKLSNTRVTVAFHLPGLYALTLIASTEPRMFYFHVVPATQRREPPVQQAHTDHGPLTLKLIDARLEMKQTLNAEEVQELMPLAAITMDVSPTAHCDQSSGIHPYDHYRRQFTTLAPPSFCNLRLLKQRIELFNKDDNEALRLNDTVRIPAVDPAMDEMIKKLHEAVAMGDIRAATELLDSGAPVDGLKEEVTPLRVAAWHGHFNIAKLLVERGANVNYAARKDIGTPIMSAALMGNESVMRLLFEKGADINNQAHTGGTALFCSCVRGLSALTALAIEMGANVNLRAFDGTTALHMIAMGGKVEDAAMLLQAGALPNVFRSDGLTPLCFAAANGNLELCRLLLDAGVDPNHHADDGMSPLCYAADAGHTQCCELLIERGATDHIDVDQEPFPVDKQNPVLSQWRGRVLGKVKIHSPLVRAAVAGHVDTCAFLLRAGADPYASPCGKRKGTAMAAAATHPSVLTLFYDFLQGRSV